MYNFLLPLIRIKSSGDHQVICVDVFNAATVETSSGRKMCQDY